MQFPTGGKGALPTSDYTFAKSWIKHHDGWGDFIAAEMLTPKTVTWLSIWYQGELILAQTRARDGWTHGNRAISGVTGVTKIGVTCSDRQVTEIAAASTTKTTWNSLPLLWLMVVTKILSSSSSSSGNSKSNLNK